MEIIIRIAVVYFFVIFGMRMLGKRELNQLSAIELVTLMLVPEIVSQALSGVESMTNALIGVATLFTLVYLTSLSSYMWKPAQTAFEGTPLVLHDDKSGLHPDVLDKERITPDEIYAELRLAGYTDLKQVKMVVLEAEGKMSIIPLHEAPHQGQGNKDAFIA